MTEETRLRLQASSGAEASGLSPAWQAVSDRPDIDKQPSRQFLIVEGSRFHSGVNWHRMWMGEAFIRRPGSDDEFLQYRQSDIQRICEDGDIDLHTAFVTYWMPAQFAPYPSSQPGIDRLAVAEKTS